MFNFLIKHPIYKVNYTQDFLRNYYIMQIDNAKNADEIHCRIKSAKKQLEKDNFVIIEKHALNKLLKLDSRLGGMRASDEDIARARKFDKENQISTVNT